MTWAASSIGACTVFRLTREGAPVYCADLEHSAVEAMRMQLAFEYDSCVSRKGLGY